MRSSDDSSVNMIESTSRRATSVNAQLSEDICVRLTQVVRSPADGRVIGGQGEKMATL